MAEAEKPEVLPPFPIEKIAAERDRLLLALTGRVGKRPDGEGFREMCGELAWALETGPSDPAVAETVRSMPPGMITAAALKLFCWRVAANRANLQRGLPARPWAGQSRPEWMAFEVMAGDLHRPERFDGKGKPGFLYQCRCISGSACPDLLPVFWTYGQINRVSREIGFARSGRKKRPYAHGLQLVRLRFAAKVEPARSADHPGFDLATLRVPAKFKKYNVEMLSRRIRREPPCPQGYGYECHRCHAGYASGAVVCPAAVRPAGWVWKYCSGCDSESWWDPAARAGQCMTCTPKKEG